MVYLVTLVVYMFVDIVYALVNTENSVIIAMINTQILVVPYVTWAAVIYSACIVPYGSGKLALNFQPLAYHPHGAAC